MRVFIYPERICPTLRPTLGPISATEPTNAYKDLITPAQFRAITQTGT
jgi:hypothetical protein